MTGGRPHTYSGMAYATILMAYGKANSAKSETRPIPRFTTFV